MAKRSPARFTTPAGSFVCASYARIHCDTFIAVRKIYHETNFLSILSPLIKISACDIFFADAEPLKAVTLEEGGEKMEIFIQLGVTVVAGALGTVIGGLILDYIRNKKR